MMASKRYESERRWRERNRDRLLAYYREYHIKNRERRNAMARERHATPECVKVDRERNKRNYAMYREATGLSVLTLMNMRRAAREQSERTGENIYDIYRSLGVLTPFEKQMLSKNEGAQA